ncbi:hypothetical protein [Pelomonas aquatica]|uniref:hypothetical protein n=1 Tax=Pelomonas aquatica TaxID=431058 RepID=UPI00227CD3A6|nr:hypothetical protein [Pelomonas aquatica]MCY4757033.1 hypothetical protein [Pelomonas aquatica]
MLVFKSNRLQCWGKPAMLVRADGGMRRTGLRRGSGAVRVCGGCLLALIGGFANVQRASSDVLR